MTEAWKGVKHRAEARPGPAGPLASSAQTAPGRQGSGPLKALTTRETPLGILRGPWAFSAATGRGPFCSLSVDSRSRPPWRAENSSTAPGIIRSVWAPPGLSVGRRRRLEGAHTHARAFQISSVGSLVAADVKTSSERFVLGYAEEECLPLL